MNVWKLTTGGLMAGCCRPIKPSYEYAMLVVIEPLALIYLKVKHKWKTANGTQHLHAAHVFLNIKCNESHTSPVWMDWKWCSSNEPASRLNVFTLHTPLWWCWCERLQVSSGNEGCQWRRGACGPWSGSGREEWESSHRSLGTSTCYGEQKGTWLIRYGPLHSLYWAAC